MKVSFIIAIYNHMDFVENSLISAFEQDYKNIEFIISDDYSTDESFDVINKIINPYKNKLNIKFHRNNRNLGVVENFKKNIQISSGEIIVGGSGDDFYEKNRVSAVVDAFEKNKKITAVFTNGYIIDKDNITKGLIFNKPPIFSESKNEMYYKKTWIHGATACYSRLICEEFCNIDFKNNFQEDSIMSFISCLYGEIKYLDEKLIFYRLHNSNVSNPNNISSLLSIFLNKHNIYKSRIYYLLNKKQVNLILFSNFFMLFLTSIYKLLDNLKILKPMLRVKFNVKDD